MAVQPTSSFLRRVFAPTIIVALAALVLFGWAMERDLNHDEHQFLAPGALLARQGAQPYRDYPLFHLPNLVFLYAPLALLTDHYILAAKALSAFASVVMVTVMVLRASQRPAFGSPRWSVPVAIAAVILFLNDPLVTWTTGKTWNHEIPACFAVLAFVCQVAAAQRNSASFVFLSGIGLGLAIGTRLTFLPIALPFLASVWLFPGTLRRRGCLALALVGGAILALLPSIYYLITSPAPFFFGNIEFPRLRLLDPTDIRAAETATWWRKLRYFFKEILMFHRGKDHRFAGSLLLILGFAWLAVSPGVAWLRAWWTTRASTRGALSPPAAFTSTGSFATALLVLVVPFLALGCALPTRYQYQHWFSLAPFLALGVVEGAAAGSGAERRWRWGLPGLAAISLFALLLGLYNSTPFPPLFHPEDWFPMRAHAYSAEIRRHAASGKVLTLAPAWPLEAGLRIYPEFATGPFGWRLAHLVKPEQRLRYKLIAPSDLESFLAPDPPAAILTGVEDDPLEEPLIAYAQRHHYRHVQLTKKRDLWLPQTGRE